MDNNFLFLCVGGESLPLTIVKRLIDECKIKNAYATVIDDSIDSTLFREKPINIWDAFIGKYPPVKELEPFDRAYHNPISEFSIEIMHQIARNGNWNFEKRVNLYYTNLKYWDNFLETRKINCVVFSILPHEIYDYIIYLLCKKKNIKVCMNFTDGYKHTVTSKAYYMLNSIDDHTKEVTKVLAKMKKDYVDISPEDIIISEYDKQTIEKIKQRFANADNSHMLLMNKGRIEEIERYYGNPKLVIKNAKNSKDFFKNLLLASWAYIVGRQKTRKLVRKYEAFAVLPDFNEKYFFYAMHYQPEASSSPLGGIYANQLLAIQLIAHNLPEGYWLYVKEHPYQTSFNREVSYYEELKKIPKVKIISQKITSEILMKNALGMATLTGTVMFESQILQKPCLCLGYTHWEALSGVYKIDTNEDCNKAISEIVAGKAKVTTEKELRLFLLTMEEVCYDRANETEYYNKILQYVKSEAN